MATITATVPAYISKYNSVDSLMRSDPNMAVCQVITAQNAPDGWVWIGSAKVTIYIADDEEIKAELVETLKEEKTRIQAETGKRITEIDQQIQSLLAIEHKAEA